MCDITLVFSLTIAQTFRQIKASEQEANPDIQHRFSYQLIFSVWPATPASSGESAPSNMTASKRPHGSASDLWIMVACESSSENDTHTTSTMHSRDPLPDVSDGAIEHNVSRMLRRAQWKILTWAQEKEVSGSAARSPDSSEVGELSLPAPTLQGPGIAEYNATESNDSCPVLDPNTSDPSEDASEKPWKEEFVKHHKAIKRARKEAQRRLWRFENTGDPDIFTTFKSAFWSWIELVKGVRRVSKEYNNDLVEEIRAFINGLRLLMDRRSDELSTVVLASDLSLDWKAMDKQFEELRTWQLFGNEVDGIFLDWVFDESMELFRECEDPAAV